MKKFWESLEEHTINFKKKKKEFIKKRTVEIIWKWKSCYICKEKLEDKHVKDKKYHKVRECRVSVHSICNLKYSVPNEIPIVFHNGSMIVVSS